MYEDGYENVINIDFPNKVNIFMDEKCREKYSKIVKKIFDTWEIKDYN